MYRCKTKPALGDRAFHDCLMQAPEPRHLNIQHRCNHQGDDGVMSNVEVFCPHSCGQQPIALHLPPSKGLYDTLRSLENFKADKPFARIVCNFSFNNLSFEHAKHLAAWLQVPGRNLHLYALDLSFNRIVAPTWAAFVPLVSWLRPYVDYMDFGGNYLPALVEIDLLKEPIFQGVSLATALQDAKLTPSSWVRQWDKQARDFRLLSYGCAPNDPRCGIKSKQSLCLYRAQLHLRTAVCCRYGVGTDCHNLTDQPLW